MVIARTVDSARLRVGCLRLILINRGTLLPCARTFHILERSPLLRTRVTVQQLSTFRLFFASSSSPAGIIRSKNLLSVFSSRGDSSYREKLLVVN